MKDLNFKDLLAKYKALPAKTKNLIMVILGIAIFIGAYMLGFQKLQESTAALQTEIGTQSAYVTELKGYYDNLATYNKMIDEDKKAINQNLSTLPLGITSEDFLIYTKTMNEKIGGKLQNVNFDVDEFIGEFGCVINEQNVTASAMRSSLSFTSIMSYSEFKNMLNYIYKDTKEVTFIDNVTVVYDSTDMVLNASFDISKYFITYDGCEYKPVAVPNMPMGNTNPFNTVS